MHEDGADSTVSGDFHAGRDGGEERGREKEALMFLRSTARLYITSPVSGRSLLRGEKGGKGKERRDDDTPRGW